jgi:DNA-binding NarL/FixJ family response regulator
MDPLSSNRTPARRSRQKLVLFCQHPVAQQRFARLLSKAGFDVVVSPELCLPHLEAPTQTAQARLVILDCCDPEAAREFLRRLHVEQPDLAVLVLLPKLEDPQIYSLLRLGVKGVLAYSQAQRELASSACQVAKGGYCVPSEILTGFIESILPELEGGTSLLPEIEVSRRERDVLNLLLENLSNKEIAARLFVSERTVKFHVSNLLNKFGVQRRAELIVLWMRRAIASAWPLGDVGHIEPESARVNSLCHNAQPVSPSFR